MTRLDPPIDSPVALTQAHDVASFECGVDALNDFLRRFALLNQRSDSARTFVACRSATVVGYYSLAAGSAMPDVVPARIRKGLASHPVPLIILTRLAVDVSMQGHGLGRGLLKDALLRAARAADIIGARAVVVHAKDESAQNFYRRFGFAPSPLAPLQCYLLMKDLRKNLGHNG